MDRRLIKVFPILFAVLFGLASCTSATPYVFKEGEFNRESQTFNKKPDDIAEVKICYNRGSTNTETLRSMAQQKCGLYGKRARFQKRDILHCPLATPIMVTFLCLVP